MSTDNTKAKQAAMEALQKINAVEGFDPSALAVEYTDLNSAGGSEKRLRLPVMAQIGWFRLKYSNPDLRGVRPPEPAAPAALDIASLVEQLQKSPELCEMLAKVLSGQGTPEPSSEI